LCTTDPEKLLETILSRCTKFQLKSPNQNVLIKFLTSVCEKEGLKVGERGNFDISKEALNLVALSGDGSYRDSLSNLQKVFSFKEEYTEEFVAKVLGLPQISLIFSFLKSLDGLLPQEEGLRALKMIETGGADTNLFAKEVVYFARLVLLARHKLLTEAEIINEYGAHVLEFINEFLKNKNPKLNSAMLGKILAAEISSKNSSLPYLIYELLLF
jgi:DNA polymerase III gamma/tau subunit